MNIRRSIEFCAYFTFILIITMLIANPMHLKTGPASYTDGDHYLAMSIQWASVEAMPFALRFGAPEIVRAMPVDAAIGWILLNTTLLALIAMLLGSIAQMLNISKAKWVPALFLDTSALFGAILVFWLVLKEKWLFGAIIAGFAVFFKESSLLLFIPLIWMAPKELKLKITAMGAAFAVVYALIRTTSVLYGHQLQERGDTPAEMFASVARHNAGYWWYGLLIAVIFGLGGTLLYLCDGWRKSPKVLKVFGVYALVLAIVPMIGQGSSDSLAPLHCS